MLHLDPSTSNGTAEADSSSLPAEPYDAAQEKLHAVQEGTEPSYASVAAGAAHANPTHSRSNSASSSATASGTKSTTKYYIKKQEDLYQVNEFLKFVSMTPGATICTGLQFLATLFCLAIATLLRPFVKAAWPLSSGMEKGSRPK